MYCPFTGTELTTWHMFGGGVGIMMFLFWALIIVGVIVGVIYLLRSLNKPIDKEDKHSSLKILEIEFAKNNIGEEEFMHKKRILLDKSEES